MCRGWMADGPAAESGGAEVRETREIGRSFRLAVSSSGSSSREEQAYGRGQVVSSLKVNRIDVRIRGVPAHCWKTVCCSVRHLVHVGGPISEGTGGRSRCRCAMRLLTGKPQGNEPKLSQRPLGCAFGVRSVPREERTSFRSGEPEFRGRSMNWDTGLLMAGQPQVQHDQALEEMRRNQTGQMWSALSASHLSGTWPCRSPVLCISTCLEILLRGPGRAAGEGGEGEGDWERMRWRIDVVWRWRWDRLGLKVLLMGLFVLPLPLGPGCEASSIRTPSRRSVQGAPL